MANNGISGIPSIARAAACCAVMLLAALPLLSPFPPPLYAQTNSEPVFRSGQDSQPRVPENTPAGRNIGEPITATDNDGDLLTYAITGADAAFFDVNSSTGQLRTKAPLNYEQRGFDYYEITLTVSDGKDASGQPDDMSDDFFDMEVEVTNVDEPGALTILSTHPYVSSVVRARLTDPDGVVGPAEWEWSRSRNGSDWSVIDTVNEGSYHLRPADAGMHLRVRATYSDRASKFEDTKTLVRVSARAGAEKPPRPVKVEEVVTGLTIPWDLAFTPDRTMLFTERGGTISARLTNGTVQSITADMSDLSTGQEAGLMSIAVDPQFGSNRRFYTCQAHTDTPGGGKTDEDDDVQVIAWTVNAGYTKATRVDDPLVGGIPSNSRHSGCRLRFGPSGYLWISTGDAREGGQPQDLASLGGKVLRVDAATGEGAPGNPFPESPLVYTYGHRNVQGLARRPGPQQMWAVEHGPDRDDEINRLVSGGNYGWDPRLGDDNLDYDESVPMTDTGKYPKAVEAKWSSGRPSVAPSGGVFLEGSGWGPWRGMLAVALLRDKTLRVFDFDSGGNLKSEYAVPELDDAYGRNGYGRLRSPVMGPDGSLYVTTSNGSGMDSILKVTPVSEPRFPYHRPLHRSVRTGAPAGSNAGAPVTARRIGGGRLTYSLEGLDASLFDIHPSTGQIRTTEDWATDTEGAQYTVEVFVHDGVPDNDIDDTVLVYITVEGRAPPPPPPQPPPSPPTSNGGGGGGGFGPAPVAPKFAEGFRAEREAFENAVAGDPVGEPVSATHPEDLGITYSLSGEDAALFAVDEDTGQIRVREGAKLTLGDSYSVNVTATDTAGTGTIIIVTIVVTEASHHPYDANKNGVIDIDEVIAAIKDYFAGELTLEEVLKVILLYFDDS